MLRAGMCYVRAGKICEGPAQPPGDLTSQMLSPAFDLKYDVTSNMSEGFNWVLKT